MNSNALTPHNPDDFEKLIALLFQQLGFEVIMPPMNTKGYDIELKRYGKNIAVQVKNHKAKCSIAQIQKFQEYLELPVAESFSEGWFVSASSFSQSALTHVATEQPSRLRLGTYRNGEVVWEYPQTTILPPTSELLPKLILPSTSELLRPLKYIGVFTCKGGVGKTTVAAHLAGAFALMGHDVILLDLDPEKNLRKLFLQDPAGEDEDASLYVPPPKHKGSPGTTITVLNHDQWNEAQYPDIKMVICDCSPVLGENPRHLVERFDYCIIPTTLSPLGIAKHADVITRTFKHIRELNSMAEMFALINGYDSSDKSEKRNEVLLAHLQKHIDSYAIMDQKCRLIHPEAAKVRYSRSLLLWGYHIIDGTKPQLAFNEIAGRSYPRMDFLQLAEYLEDHTELDKLRNLEHAKAVPD